MQFDYGKNVQAYTNKDGTIALGTWSDVTGGIWQPERNPLIIATWARAMNVSVDKMVEPLDAPRGNPANFWTRSVPLLDPAAPAPVVEPTPEAPHVPLVTHPVTPEKPGAHVPVDIPPDAGHPPVFTPKPVTAPVEVHVHVAPAAPRAADTAYVPTPLPRATEPVPAAHHNAILAILERWMSDVRHWL